MVSQRKEGNWREEPLRRGWGRRTERGQDALPPGAGERPERTSDVGKVEDGWGAPLLSQRNVSSSLIWALGAEVMLDIWGMRTCDLHLSAAKWTHREGRKDEVIDFTRDSSEQLPGPFPVTCHCREPEWSSRVWCALSLLPVRPSLPPFLPRSSLSPSPSPLLLFLQMQEKE